MRMVIINPYGLHSEYCLNAHTIGTMMFISVFILMFIKDWPVIVANGLHE